jgi:hypothetical protein
MSLVMTNIFCEIAKSIAENIEDYHVKRLIFLDMIESFESRSDINFDDCTRIDTDLDEILKEEGLISNSHVSEIDIDETDWGDEDEI